VLESLDGDDSLFRASGAHERLAFGDSGRDIVRVLAQRRLYRLDGPVRLPLECLDPGEVDARTEPLRGELQALSVGRVGIVEVSHELVSIPGEQRDHRRLGKSLRCLFEEGKRAGCIEAGASGCTEAGIASRLEIEILCLPGLAQRFLRTDQQKRRERIALGDAMGGLEALPGQLQPLRGSQCDTGQQAREEGTWSSLRRSGVLGNGTGKLSTGERSISVANMGRCQCAQDIGFVAWRTCVEQARRALRTRLRQSIAGARSHKQGEQDGPHGESLRG
jgi:hypothetical protein